MWRASSSLSSFADIGYFERISRKMVYDVRKIWRIYCRIFYLMENITLINEPSLLCGDVRIRGDIRAANSRSRNGRWIAFAQLTTAEWHVICIIRLVEQLSRTPSFGSSTLRISCSANGISSVIDNASMWEIIWRPHWHFCWRRIILIILFS